MLNEPFSLLPQTAVRKLIFGDEEIIFRMGSRSKAIYFLVKGEVHLQRYTKTGNLITIHRAFKGEYFAEASLFSDFYHCDAIAKKPCEILSISRSDTLALLQSNAKFALSVTGFLARQVQDYRRLLELRSIRSAKERVFAGIAEGWLKGSIISFPAKSG